MRSEWQPKRIGEVADVVGGGTPSTKNPENYGGEIPWITPKDLSSHHERYIRHGERNITEQGLKTSSARILPEGSVLVSSRAPVGYVAVAKDPLSTNQGFRSLLLRDGNIPEFFYYLLLANTALLESHASGTTFKEISGSSLKQIQLLVPPLEDQRAIASILGSLDDKIELNRRMNETLEALARALFKSWFVDFDPVRAKMEGRQPVCMDDETAALFPDSFEDSALGEIPKGWSAGTAGDEFDIIMGQSPPGETYNEIGEGLPFYQGRRDFKFRYPTLRVYCSAPKRTAQYGDALVSVRAPVGDVNMAESVCCVGRGVAAVRHKTGSRSYTYYAMHSLKSYFKRFESEGTVFGAVNKQGFLTIPFLLPPPALVETFESSTYPLDQRIEVQEKQSHTLAEIRDTLLPKLLSGEVRVGEAEGIVEDIV